MYHNRAFRKLGRKHTHRLATLRALSTALFRRERITTTLMKAKELRPFAEKLITRARQDNLHARRLIAFNLCLYEFPPEDVDLVILAFRKVWDNLDALRDGA